MDVHVFFKYLENQIRQEERRNSRLVSELEQFKQWRISMSSVYLKDLENRLSDMKKELLLNPNVKTDLSNVLVEFDIKETDDWNVNYIIK